MMRRLLLVGLKCLVAATLLGLLVRIVPSTEILAALASASPTLFAGGVALQFASRAIATIQLRVITASQGIELGHETLYRLLLAVQFYALVLPGTLTGGGAAWLKYIEHGVGRGTAAAVVIINRGLGLFVLIPICSAAIAMDPQIDLFAVPLAVFAVSVAALAVGICSRVDAPARDAGMQHASSGGIARFVARFLAIRHLPVRDRATAVAAAIASEMVNAMVLWTFAHAVDLPLAFRSALWIRGFLQTAMLLPVTVAGLGVREASLMGAGVLLALPVGNVVAWSFTILGGTLCVAATGALCELWWRRALGHLPAAAVRQDPPA